MEVDGDDGGGDVLGVVDDLIDSWHSLCDIHARNTCEVEGLQRHLGGWLTDTLCSQRADGLSWLYNASVYLLYVDAEEETQLEVCYAVEGVFEVVVVCLL